MNKRDQLSVNKGGLRKSAADAMIGRASSFNMLEGYITLV